MANGMPNQQVMYPGGQMINPQQMVMPQPIFPFKNQNGGFVIVKNKEEARNYPVGYGNSVTFRDEESKHVYEKTMGLSQFDRPIFKSWKLVEEADDEMAPAEPEKVQEPIDDSRYEELKKCIKDLRSQLNNVRNRINNLDPESKGGDTK